MVISLSSAAILQNIRLLQERSLSNESKRLVYKIGLVQPLDIIIMKNNLVLITKLKILSQYIIRVISASQKNS